MLRSAAQQGVSKHEGDPANASSLPPLPAPIPGGWRAFSREDVARLHRLYYDPNVQVGAIAEIYRVSVSTLLRWIAEMKWPNRRQLKQESCVALRRYGQELRAGAADGAAFGLAARDFGARAQGAAAMPALLPAGFDDRAPVDAGALVADIERAVRRELAMIEAALNDPAPGARDRHARTLATLVRTLQGVKALKDGGEVLSFYGDDEAEAPKPPRDLTKLRAELAADLDRMRAGRT